LRELLGGVEDKILLDFKIINLSKTILILVIVAILLKGIIAFLKI
jgi:hypothetical protein